MEIKDVIDVLRGKKTPPEDISQMAEVLYESIGSHRGAFDKVNQIKEILTDNNTSISLSALRKRIMGETLTAARSAGAPEDVIKSIEDLYKASLENPASPERHDKTYRPYKIEKSGSGKPVKSSWSVSGWVDLHPGVVEIGIPPYERKKKRKQKESQEERERFLQNFTVPLGQIGIALRPGGVVSHSQMPEIYIGGEGIWAGDEHFKVLLLKSVPIEARGKVSVEIPAISVSENDKAVCRTSLRLWLQDPLKFARQAIVGSTVEEIMANLSHVQERLGDAILEAWEDFLLSNTDGGELWTSDRELLEQKGYHLFEKRLAVWGLAVVEFVCARKYPQNLYDTALEIGEVEYAIVHEGNKDKFDAVFDEEEKRRWRIMHDKGALPGEWFLSAVTREKRGAAENDFAKKVSDLCVTLRAPLCERFVTEWYKLATPTERAFAKQMVLAALKRPRLVIGSWLDRMFEI